jgi:hypothetical protein
MATLTSPLTYSRPSKNFSRQQFIGGPGRPSAVGKRFVSLWHASGSGAVFSGFESSSEEDRVKRESPLELSSKSKN